MKYLKIIIGFLATFLLFSSISIASDLNPKRIEEIEGILEFQGEFNSPTKLKALNYSFYGIPEKYSNLQTGRKFFIEKDNYGNDKLILNFQDIKSEKFKVRMKIKSKSYFSFPKDVEYPYDPPQNLLEYLEEGNKTKITSKIKEKSEKIIKTSESSFEAISKLAYWVHKELEYDPSYGEMSKSSDWVYAHRKGTCDEFSTLLIAMLRSTGIPARYVAGVVYSKDGWGYHGWVEVYLDKWIPVDPTWNEVGWLDATHIPLAKFKDTGETNIEIKYKTTKELKKDIKFYTPQVDLKVLNKKLGNKILNLKIESYPKEIGIDKKSVLILKASKNKDGCISTLIHLLPRKSSSNKPSLEEKERLLILCEYNTTEYFILDPKNLDPNYIYTKIGDVKTPLSNKIPLDLTVNPSKKEEGWLKAELGKTKVLKDEIVKVYISSNKAYKIFTKLPVKNKYIISNKVGKFKVLIASESGEVRAKNLTVSNSLNFKLENISLPRFIVCGNRGNLTFYLENLGRKITLPLTFKSSKDIFLPGDSNVTLDKNETKTIKFEINTRKDCKPGEKFIYIQIGKRFYNKKITLSKNQTQNQIEVTPFSNRIKNIILNYFNTLREFFSKFFQF